MFASGKLFDSVPPDKAKVKLSDGLQFSKCVDKPTWYQVLLVWLLFPAVPRQIQLCGRNDCHLLEVSIVFAGVRELATFQRISELTLAACRSWDLHHWNNTGHAFQVNHAFWRTFHSLALIGGPLRSSCLKLVLCPLL